MRLIVPELELTAVEGAETLGVGVLALLMVLPLLLAQLPYDLTVTVAAHLPGSGALYLVFGEGPRDDMTTTSARVTLAGWALAALLCGGWRLLRSDANR